MLLFCTASAEDTTSYSAASMVSVTGVTISPDILMKGDTALVTVTITNNGDQSVKLSRAILYGTQSATGDGITVADTTNYNSIGDIGAGVSRDFVFTINAVGQDAIYYPIFYLDFQNAGSIRYPLPVKVQSDSIRVSLVDMPDVFTAEKKESVTLLIGNPRDNAVQGVIVNLLGDGVASTQSGYFLGTLKAGESTKVSLDISASYSSNPVIAVSYRNGMNTHTTSLDLAIEVGESKTAPRMVVNNLATGISGGVSTITGDVSNAGIEDARSVVVTVGTPARAIDPYSQYVIGSLESDDFSSFEVTYDAGGHTSIPIIVSYKDLHGNDYTMTYLFDTGAVSMTSGGGVTSSGSAPAAGGQPGGMGMMGMSGAGLGSLPLLEFVLFIGLVVAVVICWRRGYLARAFTILKMKLKKD
ncbi:COG1361 S-layer family protein [Methanocalculus sp.]|uniref:COG1361 S-layer family protein n=1 Tax=Methanocalculus sp. TaxID=2004547 RepID=UPI00272BF9A2|nr:hypothetical protein [Methanocalculus sp.]